MSCDPSPRYLAVALGVVLLGGATACNDASRHASDGDTGAAAPATVRDMSATPRVGDSTAGVARATGQPAAAGDTLGARARQAAPKPKTP